MQFELYIEDANTAFKLEDFKQKVLIEWLERVCDDFRVTVSNITYIFCDDAYLIKLNQKHLNHDTFTDIITFQYCEAPIEGEVYISTERIKENANQYGVSFSNELNRVIAHGLLHLIGYADKSVEDKEEMTKQENYCLSLWKEN